MGWWDKIDDPFKWIGAEVEKRTADLSHKVSQEISERIEEVKHDVRVAVECAILRETCRFELSRLMTLDPANKAKYEDALLMIK